MQAGPKETPEVSLQSIINQCVAGDPKAQRALFQRFKRMFLSLAYKNLGPGFDLDEVVHEIFIQIYKGLPAFGFRSAFETWAYRVGLNVCVSHLRDKFRKRKLNLVPESRCAEARTVAGGETPVQVLEGRELEKKIFEALDCLDERKRIVVVLHDMEEKTLDEIAEIIRKPVGTVKSRLFHGRNELKELLSGYLKE